MGVMLRDSRFARKTVLREYLMEPEGKAAGELPARAACE
jgi:hypothetical protein